MDNLLVYQVQVDRPSQCGFTLESIVVEGKDLVSDGVVTFIEIDGEILVDANIQDTVKHTLMRNYAVMELAPTATIRRQYF